MSYQAQESVLNHTCFIDPRKHFIPYRILHALASLADKHGRVGVMGEPKKCPTIRTIAEIARVHRNSVLKWLPKIESAGEIAIHKFGAGRGAYQIIDILLVENQPHDTSEINESTNEKSAKNDKKPQINSTSPAEINGTQPQINGTRPKINGTRPTREAQINGTRLMHVPDPSLDPLDQDPGGDPSPTPLPSSWFATNDLPPPESEREARMLAHPAIVLWLSVVKRWPGYEIMPFIIAALGDDPNPKVLEQVWIFWNSQKYRPTNWQGVLDRYEDRLERERRKLKRTQARPNQDQSAMQAFASQYDVSGVVC